MEEDMKDWKYAIAYILGLLIIILLACILANVTYGVAELNAFNRLNKTNYTMDQWRVYQYDIKKLHPFTGQEAQP
jgi:hypothetical protein